MLTDIDIVYLWCDINDEKFRRKKADFSGFAMPSKESDHACHYRSNDELKYSLRSVKKYAPWIRNIYIVNDEQTPPWLNAEHPQVKIIDVKEIMPETALPCFNSCAIEHCLDNIPGLSECFLYSNDDMFFGNPVFPENSDIFISARSYAEYRFRVFLRKFFSVTYCEGKNKYRYVFRCCGIKITFSHKKDNQ